MLASQPIQPPPRPGLTGQRSTGSQLLYHIPLQPTRRVHRRPRKRRHQNPHQGNSGRPGHSNRPQQIRRSVHKRRHHGSQRSGGVPRNITGRPRSLPNQRRAARLHPQTEPGGARQNHQCRQEPLGQHPPIPDKTRIGFAPQLLAARAAAHQAMETADRAARDRDEQERKHRRRTRRIPFHHGRDDRQLRPNPVRKRRATEQCRRAQAHQDQGQRGKQLQRVDVVPRLQKDPDRQHGSNIGVQQKQENPHPARPACHRCIDGMQPAHVTVNHGQVHRDQRNQRRQEQADALSMQPIPDRNGNRYLDCARKYRCRVLPENRGDHHPEDGQHHRQRHQQHEQKQQSHPTVQYPPRNVPHRLPVVPQAHHQRAKVVHRANENRPHQHPQQRRQPAPHNRNRRPHDRPRPRNRRKMMPEYDPLRRGHVVHPVVHPDGRTYRCRRKLENLPSKPPPVGVIRHNKAQAGKNGDKQSCHVQLRCRRFMSVALKLEYLSPQSIFPCVGRLTRQHILRAFRWGERPREPSSDHPLRHPRPSRNLRVSPLDVGCWMLDVFLRYIPAV